MLDATPVILYTAGMIGWAVAMVWLFRELRNHKKKDGDDNNFTEVIKW